MAITCFVEDDGVTLDVDDPGYGYLLASRFNNRDDDREVRLRGKYMWRALENVTELALTDDELDAGSTYDVDGLWPMTIAAARRLLPRLQTAVLYAAAGSDRAERLDEDVDEMPDDLLCARCNEGSVYSGYVMTSELCEQYGHQPFGYVGKWESAQDALAWDRRWAETRRRNEQGTDWIDTGSGAGYSPSDHRVAPTDTVG